MAPQFFIYKPQVFIMWFRCYCWICIWIDPILPLPTTEETLFTVLLLLLFCLVSCCCCNISQFSSIQPNDRRKFSKSKTLFPTSSKKNTRNSIHENFRSFFSLRTRSRNFGNTLLLLLWNLKTNWLCSVYGIRHKKPTTDLT